MNLYTTIPKTSKFPKFVNELVVSDGTNEMLLYGNTGIGNLDKIQSMSLKETDTLLISYPRTGTTITQRIILVLKQGSAKKLNEPGFSIHSPFPFLEYNTPDYNGYDTAQNNIQDPYRLLKTHLTPWLLPKCSNVKKIFVTRDVRDTLVSRYHFLRNNKSAGEEIYNVLDFATFYEMFVAGHIRYGDWFHWHRLWLDATDEKTSLWVFYEDLLQKFDETVRKIAKFMDVELTPTLLVEIKEAVNFNKMKTEVVSKSVNDFVRKGIVGDHVNYLNEEQINFLNRKTKDIVPELFK